MSRPGGADPNGTASGAGSGVGSGAVPVAGSDGYLVRDRREHFDGPIFQVYTDSVQMPDGRLADRDFVVHMGAVGVVALDEDGRVVLIQQYRHPMGRRLWELPAGLADVPGEPALDTAARELAEEADLTATQWDFLVEVQTSPGYSTEAIRLYLARGLAPVPAADRHVRTHEEAGMVIERVDLDEAVRMALAGEITNATAVVGVLAAARARDRDWVDLRDPAAVPEQHYAPPDPVPAGR